ncbi:peptidyl-alpha-hydroxyglycine alpha-amidating lyase family protein [Priestia koreensis]|uniref:peptidyl-alpha-hydroxyglycine alpha-amidating lyase family protein n=1 Tax=Priestia koreensis TaxID=284581 RepID=UPI001F57AA7C|nr:peptidyl-alpha-hydroxyglycine alpha-amidating lyase family protein [Priestia koreensis]UNL86829.1 peptidylamidoglycolate lyase [Priestia koreensis]
MKKKIIYPVLVILLIGITFIWLRSGGSETIYKKKSMEKEVPSSYTPEILWPTTKEDQKVAGEASGVAIDSHGNIYYLHRGKSTYGGNTLIKENTVIVIDGETHSVKKRWGKNIFKSPHGLEIDLHDNIWITDITLNKVYKFSSNGTLLKTFGSDYPFYMEGALRVRNELPHFPTGMDEYTFARPTDLTVYDDGSFVVSDGYRNHRIVKFNKDGKFMWERNELGNGPEAFNLPHGISHDKQGNLYVADRNNARIQVLNKNGDYITSWRQKEIGRPFGVEVGDDEKVYVVDGGNSLYPEHGKGSNQVIVLNKKGVILNRFGKWGVGKGQLEVPHDIAVDKEGNIFVAELRNERLQEFKVMKQIKER